MTSFKSEIQANKDTTLTGSPRWFFGYCLNLWSLLCNKRFANMSKLKASSETKICLWISMQKVKSVEEPSKVMKKNENHKKMTIQKYSAVQLSPITSRQPKRYTPKPFWHPNPSWNQNDAVSRLQRQRYFFQRFGSGKVTKFQSLLTHYTLTSLISVGKVTKFQSVLTHHTLTSLISVQLLITCR